MKKVKVKLLSCVQLFATLWTVACQAPLSMEFSPGKNTGVACHFLLQEIFPTQGSSLCLLHCRQILSQFYLEELALWREDVGEGNGNPVQYSYGQRSLEGC